MLRRPVHQFAKTSAIATDCAEEGDLRLANLGGTVAGVVAYGVAMTWKNVRDVAGFAVVTLTLVTLVDLLTGDTLPSLRLAVQFTLGLVAIRILQLVAKALWRRWRGPRAPRPDTPA